jgi:hypothetical protein
MVFVLDTVSLIKINSVKYLNVFNTYICLQVYLHYVF